MDGADTSTATSASRGRRLWPAIGLVATCALAITPFVADASSRDRVPSADDLTAATDAIRADFREGDAVRVEPSWWVLPWHHLERMGPGTEAWPFPALMASEDFDPVEAYSFSRLFVLAGFAREPGLPAELRGEGRSPVEIHRGERVAVTRWELTPGLRLRTLTREWDTLRVERRFGPSEPLTPCKVRGGKHRCGRDGWMDVALESRVVWRREVRWLFVHPGPAGQALEVTWSNLPRATDAGPTWLYVRAGPSLEAVRHPEGKEVTIEVVVDGVTRDRFSLDPRRFWMERRAIRMPQGADEASVTFRVTCEEPGWRETMLEADVFASLPEALRAWSTAIVE